LRFLRTNIRRFYTRDTQIRNTRVDNQILTGAFLAHSEVRKYAKRDSEVATIGWSKMCPGAKGYGESQQAFVRHSLKGDGGRCPESFQGLGWRCSRVSLHAMKFEQSVLDHVHISANF